MGGDEVDRAERPSATLVEQVARARETAGEVGELAVIAFPEGAYRVAELVVPLRPARREAPDLIATGAAVPGLGDQLGLGQHRVLAAGDEKSVAFVEAFVLATEDGRQIEAEAVHVHLGGPVAQRIGDHLQHAGVAHVQGVAGA